MVTRIHFDDGEDADALADVLYAAGHDVAVIKERFDGEDDDEEIDYVVATPATEAQVRAAAPALAPEVFVETDDEELPVEED